MNWILKKSQQPKQLTPVEKLKAFHDLAKDALERAYSADTSGASERAIKLYNTGLQAIQEALALPVQGSGLGPRADNVASWKHDLSQWQALVRDRMRYLESGVASTTAPAPAPVRPQHSTSSTGIRPPAAAPAGTAPAAAAAQRQRPASAAGARRSQSPTLKPQPAQQQCAPGTRPGGGSTGGSTGSTASKEDQKYRDIILGEVLDNAPSVNWNDIAGLQTAKQALLEAVVLPNLRSDIFTGLRAPVRGILLYGPPGNGKTMLGKALAHEAQASFFAISASSLTSKWVGEAEKLVRALFEVAAEKAPAIIFMDEIDSILSARSSSEHDAMRRLKTEFLVQFDGVAGGNDRVVVIGATNRPQEIDDAVRRRLVKRIYIPLPDEEGRRSILRHLLQGLGASGLSKGDVDKIVRATPGYSASDLTALCKEAAMGPIRELGSAITSVKLNHIRAVDLNDFAAAMNVIKPSVNKEALQAFDDFTREFGTM